MTRSASPPRRLDARDLGCIVLVLALLALHVVRTFDFTLPPYEDAAILMRYAAHVAEGHGIVWNVGEPPVDGATDFLLMMTLAWMGELGLTIDAATYVLGFASHVLTILLVYAGVRRLHGAPRWMAFLSAAFIAFGPGIRYVEAYFGTPYFGLFSALTWYHATRAFKHGESTVSALTFAVSGLLLGLTRPEGVFLAFAMLAGLVLARGLRATRLTILFFLLVFGTLGTAYFAWRWSHFGYPLPNTYYIKGGKTVHWGHLMGGVRHLVALTLPLLAFLPLFVVAEVLATDEGRQEGRKELFFSLFPIVAFTLVGVLHEGLMDYLHRFQYCLVPILLMAWPPLLLRTLDLLNGGRAPAAGSFRARFGTAAAGLLVVGSLYYDVKTYPTGRHKHWGTYNVGQILAEYPRDYTIAVTNAGHLPYVSRWNAIDAWGLNDQEIAHEGLSAEILERWRPEVIQFDADFSPLSGVRDGRTPWAAATLVMKEYADANGYVLAAAYGYSPYKSHHYYVRPDFPESARIVERIRAVDYHISGSPARCFDFSAADREER
jgi:hypothetical protein